MMRQIRLTGEVNFDLKCEVGDAYVVECGVCASQIEGMIIRIKVQEQNMVSKVNEIIKRSWDGRVVLKKRLKSHKASAFSKAGDGETEQQTTQEVMERVQSKYGQQKGTLEKPWT